MFQFLRHRAGSIIFVALVCSALVWPARSPGQDAGAPLADAAAPQLEPPELLEAAEPTYPPQARAQRLGGRVVLELLIDSSGRVAEASVVEAAGHGFDEAAREAALRSRFAPARRDGQAVQARIRYPFLFGLPSEPPPDPPAPLPDAPAAATTPEPAAPAAAATASDPPLEVEVRGAQRESERMEQSAEAVNVIDTRIAKQRSADLGEVLARTSGISVQREGGLGSETSFALGGLYDEQVRFFVDGVPLDQSGYPFGIADVPVNLLDHVEVYRGVVPMRFGADALGGAVNLVTDMRYRPHLSASYQLGAFGTRRVTALGRAKLGPSGIFVGGSGYFDFARNDYEVEVPIPDMQGRVRRQTVKRRHDRYKAYGGNLEIGAVDRPWAKRLVLRGFASAQEQEIQSNVTMTAPYGELRSKSTGHGATLLYDVALHPNLELELVGNYARTTENFIDKADYVYDWFGRRAMMRNFGGETNSMRKFDTRFWQNSWFGRAVLQWAFFPEHILRLAIAPSTASLTGDERVQRSSRSRDPATAKRNLFTLVGGLEYQWNFWSGRISNIAFVKGYAYGVTSEEPPISLLADWTTKEDSIHRLGVGDALRIRLTAWLDAKLSYEYATRLPTPEELFGDGGFLFLANTSLKPEVSHNGNLGLRGNFERSGIGDFGFETNAFVRATDDLIVLDQDGRLTQYKNLRGARSLGLENEVSWLDPEEVVALQGMLTWQDVRNTSTTGESAKFEGERVPNRPYLFASWSASCNFEGLLLAKDSVRPFYDGRYVHAFYRSLESLGKPEFKLGVPAQVTHSLGVTWSLNREVAFLTFTLELDNVTDAKVYDVYGAQRPGRAFYLKLTGELR